MAGLDADRLHVFEIVRSTQLACYDVVVVDIAGLQPLSAGPAFAVLAQDQLNGLIAGEGLAALASGQGFISSKFGTSSKRGRGFPCSSAPAKPMKISRGLTHTSPPP